MNKAAFCALFAVAALQLFPSLHAEPPATSIKVYVAPFVSHGSFDPTVLSSLRDLFEEEFEAEFARTGTYSVLNRDTVEHILSEARNEQTITSIDQLNAKERQGLTLEKADGFIFGTVTDDKLSGDVVVSVKLQKFNSELVWNVSTSIRHGFIYDQGSRKTAMKNMVAVIHEQVSEQLSPPVLGKQSDFIDFPRDALGENGAIKDCAEIEKLRSVYNLVSTTVDFVNASQSPRDLNWIDFNGQLKFYNSLAPQTAVRALTYDSHYWVISDSSKHCLAVYVTGKKSAVVTITH